MDGWSDEEKLFWSVREKENWGYLRGKWEENGVRST